MRRNQCDRRRGIRRGAGGSKGGWRGRDELAEKRGKQKKKSVGIAQLKKPPTKSIKKSGRKLGGISKGARGK